MQLTKVLDILRTLAPEELAESWDRVGLHVGRARQTVRRALLCIDLTEPVVAEAKRAKVELIVAYHPPIFEPLSELTDRRLKPRIVLELAQAGIAVYSPHTALDVAAGGVNDWLVSGLGEGDVQAMRPVGDEESLRSVGGAGRVVALSRAITLATLTRRVKMRLGVKHVEVAAPLGRARRIKHVGVCAGAGGSLLEQHHGPLDAFVTGEMRHHDVLAAVGQGTAIVLAGHTQTERPYLSHYRRRLQAATGRAIEWRISRADKAPSVIR